jgi:hypothetical protein
MAGVSYDRLPRTVCAIPKMSARLKFTNVSRTLVSTIRFLADFPCPHCLVLKSQVGDLGLPADTECRQNVRKYPAAAVKRARKRIFEMGGSVNYRGIEDELTKGGSWVPTEVGSTCVVPPSIPD